MLKQIEKKTNLYFSLTNYSFLFAFSLLVSLGLPACEPGGASRGIQSSAAEEALFPPPDYTNKKAAGWNRDGIDHLKREHWRKAAADFGRALEEDPDFAEAHFNRALGLQAQGKMEEADEHFRLAVKNAGGDPKIMDSPVLPEVLKIP